MVTQRTANPCTPVRFRLGPPSILPLNRRTGSPAGKSPISAIFCMQFCIYLVSSCRKQGWKPARFGQSLCAEFGCDGFARDDDSYWPVAEVRSFRAESTLLRKATFPKIFPFVLSKLGQERHKAVNSLYPNALLRSHQSKYLTPRNFRLFANQRGRSPRIFNMRGGLVELTQVETKGL